MVLGEPGEAFSDAAALLDYGFAAFDRRTFIEQGERFPAVTLHGESVPIAAEESLRGLVPTGSGTSARRVVTVDHDAPFPPATGDAVASLHVTDAGKLIGSVPLVATARPQPPPPPPGGWIGRAVGAVHAALSDALSALLS